MSRQRKDGNVTIPKTRLSGEDYVNVKIMFKKLSSQNRADSNTPATLNKIKCVCKIKNCRSYLHFLMKKWPLLHPSGEEILSPHLYHLKFLTKINLHSLKVGCSNLF